MKKIALVGVLFFTFSCTKLTTDIDDYTFEHFGGTLFSSPNVVSMKEIHLDNGKLLGREVIVEGAVIKVGKYGTHLVMTDDSARMLVVLSHLPNAQSLLDKSKDTPIKILGTVERGKKGLPLLMAKVLVPSKKT